MHNLPTLLFLVVLNFSDDPLLAIGCKQNQSVGCKQCLVYLVLFGRFLKLCLCLLFLIMRIGCFLKVNLDMVHLVHNFVKLQSGNFHILYNTEFLLPAMFLISFKVIIHRNLFLALCAFNIDRGLNKYAMLEQHWQIQIQRT